MANTFLVDIADSATFGYSLVSTIVSDTTTAGTGVDMQGTEGPVHGMILTGNAGDLKTAFVVSLTESETSAGIYTAIDGASVTFAASATANDNTANVIVGKNRSKRYVKAEVVTSGGGTVSVPIAVGILGRKKITGSGRGTVT